MWLVVVGMARAWEPGESPVRWCVEAREGWDTQVVQDAWDGWAALGACTSLQVERVDDCAQADVRVALGDPDDEVAADVAVVTDAHGIVINDDWDWATDAETCEDQLVLSAFLRHAIGDVLGLAHTCDEDETCTDESDRDAVMYWSLGVCEVPDFTESDFEALAAVYGPAAVVVDDPVAYSLAVGEELCLDPEIVGDPDALEYGVSWGDGERGGELCHTYDAEGDYTVQLAYAWPIECGDYAAVRTFAYATVCEAPHAEAGADGFFTWTTDGNAVSLDNRLDTTVYGCVDTVQWTAYDGDELVYTGNTWSPTIDFGAPGTYRVVLDAAGPGGVTANEAEVTVGSSGCATVSGGPWWLAAALLARRRRG